MRLFNDYREPVYNKDEVRIILLWWAIRDSNPGPTGYEPAALTS